MPLAEIPSAPLGEQNAPGVTPGRFLVSISGVEALALPPTLKLGKITTLMLSIEHVL